MSHHHSQTVIHARNISVFVVGVVGVTLAVSLLWPFSLTPNAPGWVRLFAINILAVCENSSTQWMVVVCLLECIAACAFLKSRQAGKFGREREPSRDPLAANEARRGGLIQRLRRMDGAVFAMPDFWLLAFILFAVLRYFIAYEAASQSLHLLGLMAGVAAGKASACLLTHGYRRKRSIFAPLMCFLALLVFALAIAAVCHPKNDSMTYYRGVERWYGVWKSPNHFGSVMGTGLVLAAGLLALGWNRILSVFKVDRAVAFRSLTCALMIAAGGACAVGLLKSFSRGAWLGTVLGFGFLVLQQTKRPVISASLGKVTSCLRLNLFPSAILLFSLFVISFWQFRHTEQVLFRRVFSVANVNDFSWRNRVAFWSGGLAALADKPIFGYGWGSWGASFHEKYKADRLESLITVENDYLTIGISCGLPAVACLLIYVGGVFWRTLFRGKRRDDRTLSPTNKLGVICAAGAMVMAVGFFFTSGLMNLEMCVLFWVLLELARVGSAANEHRMKSLSYAKQSIQVASILATNAIQQKQTAGNASRLLRFAAMIVTTIAIGLTSFYLGAPQLGISKRSISIARNHLVSPHQAADFDFLASKPIWSEKKLKTLLTHVELANYTRQLVNWKLDDEIYRDFVLSPGIETRVDSDLGWRRELWEHFYPRIRQITDIPFAAETITKQLKPRFSQYPISESNPPRPILEVWRSRNQPVSQLELEALMVASLRSAGIPARLNGVEKAEYWNGSEWSAAFPTAKW